MKDSPTIEYITCESGDWVVIKEMGVVFYEGHSVPDHVWLGLLENFVGRGDNDIKQTQISDKDMEEGNY